MVALIVRPLRGQDMSINHGQISPLTLGEETAMVPTPSTLLCAPSYSCQWEVICPIRPIVSILPIRGVGQAGRRVSSRLLSFCKYHRDFLGGQRGFLWCCSQWKLAWGWYSFFRKILRNYLVRKRNLYLKWRDKYNSIWTLL